MGTIKKGILGGFSGKVGTVVGSAYMRSLPQNMKNPRTEGQVSQRTKFSIALSFLKPMTAFIRTGWKLYANKQSPFNAAMSYTLANAIIGNYPDYEIDPSKVLVSRGTLAPATNATATDGGGNIVFSWYDNSGTGSAKETDKTLIAIINLTKAEVITEIARTQRADTSQTATVPADWSGDTVETYLGFISEDGKEVANSLYLGSITIT